MAKDEDLLKEALEAFEQAQDSETDNRTAALDDLKFARLGEQWPEQIRRQREIEGRPCLTINRMPSFIRQVVNDSRQNKPQIKVKPVDDDSDIKTAEVLTGLIRNIEHVSKADIAYDTAIDNAASCGFGYLRARVDYEYDDAFDLVIFIDPVPNPFSVYGDPSATSLDGSDWNTAFVTDFLSKDEFQRKYKGAEKVDWKTGDYSELKSPWRDNDDVMVAEWWKRDEVVSTLLMLSDGSVVSEEAFKAAFDVIYGPSGIQPVNSRPAKSYKITHRIMSGAEILETNEWAGKYIPIVPVYGEEVNIEGKRHFRSLIRDAKDAQRMFNYWRTNSTETVALAPKVPFIAEEGAFDVDAREASKWATSNTQNHPYLLYKKGYQIPQRQPMDVGSAVGSMSEAMASSDDMKSIMGLYDASLGQKSNETSGRAINARKLEGDTSTFHFVDNLSRSIRHLGCVVVDLIPKVYSTRKMLRILGEDGTNQNVRIGDRQPEQEQQDPMEPSKLTGVYDLSVGRYDVAIDTGPSYTTRREETAAQMTEFARAYPGALPLIGDIMVKSLDWQYADEIAQRLKAMVPQQAQGGLPPELQQQISEGQQLIQQQGQELQQAEQESQLAKAEKMLADKSAKLALQEKDLQLMMKDFEIAKLQASADMQQMGMKMQAQTQAAQPAPAAQINLPDNIAESVAAAVAPVMAQSMTEALASMPPLRIEQPKPVRMRRVPMRDQNGMIVETVDEPIEDDPAPELLN